MPAFAIAISTGLILTAPAAAQTATGELVVTAPRAAPGSEVRKETIRFADLNLKSDAGAETLIGRVRGAAQRVCSPLPIRGSLRDPADYRNCMNEAVSGALKASGSELALEIFKRTG